MATITSIASGNWENIATWDSNTVPLDTDDVIIKTGHIVLIESITVRLTDNTVTVEGGGKLQVGKSKGIYGTLILDGCTLDGSGTLSGSTLSGAGYLDLSQGYISSNPAKVSRVQNIIVESSLTSSSSHAMSYDLQNVIFKNVRDLDFYHGTTAIPNHKYIFKNCVFDYSNPMFLKSNSGTSLKSVTVENCTFLAATANISNAAIPYLFKRCVFYRDGLLGGGAKCNATRTASSEFQECVFVNQYLEFMRYVTYTNCYFALDVASSGTGYATGGGDGAGVVLQDSVVYVHSNIINARPVSKDKAFRNFVESLALGGTNTFIGGDEDATTEWKNNVVIGTGDGFTSLFGQANGTVVNMDIQNNTMVTAGVFGTFESYTPAPDSTISIKNNLSIHALGYDPQRYMQTINNTTGPINVTCDYNHAYNISDWLASDVIVNLVAGDNNVQETSEVYPDFVDGVRNHTTYAETLGGTTYKDVFTYLLGMNGYNATTGYHSDTPIKEGIIAEIHDYFFEGYTPKNMALATASDTGSFVGAIEPKISAPAITAIANLSVSPSSAKVGTTATFTVRLTNAVEDNTTISVTINGQAEQRIITVGQTTATITYSQNIPGQVTGTITSITNDNVTAGTSSASVTFTEETVDPPVDPPIDPPSSVGSLYWNGHLVVN